MKKIILIVLLSLLFPTNSFANTTKVKNSCKVVNSVKVINNTKYICLNKNNKKIWVKKVLPKIINTQEASETKIAETKTAETKTAEKPLIELTKVQSLYKKIYDSFVSNENKVNLNVVNSPAVDEQRVNEIISYYEKAINSYPFLTTHKITWVFFNETERIWWTKKSLELDPNPYPDWWDSSHCVVSSLAVCAYGNGNVNNPIFYMLVGSLSKWEEKHQLIADHEAVHVYQTATWGSLDHPNCWIVEGHANAIGVAMSSKTINIVDYRNSQISSLDRVFPNYRSFDIEEWIQIFNRLNSDRNFCFNNGIGYSLGMIAVESMYNLYSADLVNAFIIDYSKTRDFSQSLTTFFNINEKQFYQNVLEYVKIL